MCHLMSLTVAVGSKCYSVIKIIIEILHDIIYKVCILHHIIYELTRECTLIVVVVVVLLCGISQTIAHNQLKLLAVLSPTKF